MTDQVSHPLLQRPFLLISIAVVVIGAWFWFSSKGSRTTHSQEPTPRPFSAYTSSPPQSQASPKINHPIFTSSSRFQSNENPPEEDLEILIALLDTYRRDFGGNPIGENEEIFASLCGENHKKIRYLRDDVPGMLPSGIVADRWGTPWRFHAISGWRMQITSAGPDLTFGTADDIHHE